MSKSKSKVKASIDAVINEQNKIDVTPSIQASVINEQNKIDVTPSIQASVVSVNVTEVRAPGRPPVPGSKRQLELAEKEQRKAANNGVIPKGRPVAPDSKKQKRAAELARLKSLGLGKPGQHGMYLKKNGLLNDDGTINEAKCKEFHGITE